MSDLFKWEYNALMYRYGVVHIACSIDVLLFLVIEKKKQENLPLIFLT